MKEVDMIWFGFSPMELDNGLEPLTYSLQVNRSTN